MENNKLRFTLDDGSTKEVYVIDIFGIKKYPEKEYIVYTFSEEQDGNVCISQLVETESEFKLKSIDEEEEWLEVQRAIRELENTLEGGNSATI